MKPHTKHRWLFAPLLSLGILLSACGSGPRAQQPTERQVIAQAMFQERCKTAGEKIYRTVENVEGIYLMKLRPSNINYGDQFKLDDPYGRDLDGDGYIESFLKGSFEVNIKRPEGSMTSPKGYSYVEVLNENDGKIYRYTGHVEEPWKNNKSFSMGYMRFVLEKNIVNGLMSKYGVTYDDISTQQERNFWIAGSSLKIIDIKTKEVIAERKGYMVDWAQGSQIGGRSPWLLAANNACPEFSTRHGASMQSRQTQKFVEKVLIPFEGK